MTGSVILLSIAYAAVAGLLLNLCLATRYPVWIKGMGVVLVSGLYVGSWAGLNGLMGWATVEPLPEEFRVLFITMDEPDKATKEPGYIYFWVRTLDEAGLPVGAPRAHRVAWTEEGAEAAQEALDRMDEGELLNGRIGRNLVRDQEPPETGAEYAGDQTVTGAGAETPEFEFIRVPPPALPPKSLPDAESR